MNPEQKAKAYDEALEKAIKLQENSNGMILKKWLWNIFPELKENEDEKIRKALIRFHKSTIDIDGIKGAYVIAWLEKQGEKKPAWSEEDEQHIDSLLKRLDGLCRNEFERTRFAINEDKDWLESLKQRIGG